LEKEKKKGGRHEYTGKVKKRERGEKKKRKKSETTK
jgi:hypothetical protein